MPVPENQDPGANPGLFSNLRSFWSVLVAILQGRLELATTELEEGGAQIFRLILTSFAALLVGIITVFFLFFFLIVLFWDQRVLVIGLVFGTCFLTSAILVLSALRMARERPRFLGQTLTELQRDVAGLPLSALLAKVERKPAPKLTAEELAGRRRRLTADIARQRTEFSAAYARLEEPIRYTDKGLRGFGFLRSNPWIIAAVPATVSVLKTLFGGRSEKKKTASETTSRPAPGAAPPAKGFRKTVATWAGYGWRLVQLYRQVRSYLP